MMAAIIAGRSFDVHDQINGERGSHQHQRDFQDPMPFDAHQAEIFHSLSAVQRLAWLQLRLIAHHPARSCPEWRRCTGRQRTSSPPGVGGDRRIEGLNRRRRLFSDEGFDQPFRLIFFFPATFFSGGGDSVASRASRAARKRSVLASRAPTSWSMIAWAALVVASPFLSDVDSLGLKRLSAGTAFLMRCS
jgi:hypothetical protein